VPKLSRINKEKQVNAIMVPHAGYVYSGPTAAHAYSKLVKDGYPETFVILCPNHTGYGADVSVYNEGSWVVPNGVCDVDNELADEIIKNTYKTLMTRGMKGCYIYCCDKALADYLRQRINISKA
jgi:AmmeMemoRadiSam system protein B